MRTFIQKFSELTGATITHAEEVRTEVGQWFILLLTDDNRVALLDSHHYAGGPQVELLELNLDDYHDDLDTLITALGTEKAISFNLVSQQRVAAFAAEELKEHQQQVARDRRTAINRIRSDIERFGTEILDEAQLVEE